MTIKRFSATLTALILAVTMTACGNEEESDKNKSTTTTVTTVTTTTAADTPQTTTTLNETDTTTTTTTTENTDGDDMSDWYFLIEESREYVATNSEGTSARELKTRLTDLYMLSEDIADYVIENCEIDWNEEAVKCAKSRVKILNISQEGLKEYLIKYCGFTEEESAYGAENCGADWNEEAKAVAEDLIIRQEWESYSKNIVKPYLTQKLEEEEKFTSEQIEYALNALGF